MEEIKLTYKQAEFAVCCAEGKNIFLTGEAGTGKSMITKATIHDFSASNRKAVACAPTGVAAINVGGETIHSLFGLPINGVLNYEKCRFLRDEKRSILSKVETIFFDEVSMMRPDTLDAIHWTLKKNGLKGLDQRQLIFIGDMYQLPPILDDNERTVLYQTYKGDTFFDAQLFTGDHFRNGINYQTIELDEIKRQSDLEFIQALNVVRKGGKHPYFKQFVLGFGQTPKGIILAPHNLTVFMYNEAGLKQQPGDTIHFEAEIEGEAKPEEFRFERDIYLKHGCKIMYLVNSQDNPLRNGTLGTFIVRDKQYFIRVGEIDYALGRVTQEKKKYIHNPQTDTLDLQIVGSITQYPIKLAYALSIHKAQGLTFDEVTIDLSRHCFQSGQMYVALSRVRTPQGLKIIV